MWASNAFTEVEEAIYEIGAVSGAVEALRSDLPIIHLKRMARCVQYRDVQYKYSVASFMDKPHSTFKCEEDMYARVKALGRWLQSDNGYCDSFLSFCKPCFGVVKTEDGAPLVHFGDADFVYFRRPENQLLSDTENGIAPQTVDARNFSKAMVQIQYPVSIFIKFCVHRADRGPTLNFAP